MAQANVVSITDKDRSHSRSFRSLEGYIHDLVSMASIAQELVSDNLCDVQLGKVYDRSVYDRTIFAVNHLEEMIAAFKREYYARYHLEK